MFLARLAWRNLWRNRRRTLLTLTAMVLSVAFLIFMLAVWEGMMADALASVTRSYYGHIQIAPKGYFTHPQVWRTLPESLRAELLAQEEVIGVSGRVETFGLFISDTASIGARILGVDLGEESNVTDMLAHLDGTFPHLGEVVLGEGLARGLGVKVGDAIGVLGQAADGSILAENLRVSGLLRTGNPQVDGRLAVMDRSHLQNLLGIRSVHVMVLRLRKPLAVESWHPQISLPDAEWKTWMDFLPSFAQIFKTWRATEIFFGMLFYFAIVLPSFWSP